MRRAAAGFFVVLLLFVGPLALLVATIVPTATSPSRVTEAAIAADVTTGLRNEVVERAAVEFQQAIDLPVPVRVFERALERHVTQAYFDGELRAAAATLDAWFASEAVAAPRISFDLTPVKISFAADELSLGAIAAAGCLSGPCPSTSEVADQILGEVPDRVDLTDAVVEDTSDDLVGLRDTARGLRRFAWTIAIVAVMLLAALALAGRDNPTRLRWGGIGLLVVSIPALLVALFLPGRAAGSAEDLAPDELRVDAAKVEDFLSRLAGWSRWVAIGLLLAGVAAIAAGYRTRSPDSGFQRW